MSTPLDRWGSISGVLAPTARTRRRRRGRCEHDEGSSVAGATGRASARGLHNGMRAGFRPDQAGCEEESRIQSSAGQARGEEEDRGQGSAGSANAQEEGRGSAKAGGRPPQGGTRPPEEDKPAEEGAKRAEEESRLPTAAEPEIGEVGPGRPNTAYPPASRGELAPPRSAARRGLLAADIGCVRLCVAPDPLRCRAVICE